MSDGAFRWNGKAEVVEVGRGFVTLSLDGAAVRLVADEETERSIAAHLYAKGRAVLVFDADGATEESALSSALWRADEAEASVERLKSLVAELEKNKGVLSARMDWTDRSIVVCCPSGDEPKIAALLMAGRALHEYGLAATLLQRVVGKEAAKTEATRLAEELYGRDLRKEPTP